MKVRSIFQQSYDETSHDFLVSGVKWDQFVPRGVAITDKCTVRVCAPLEDCMVLCNLLEKEESAQE